MKNIWLFSDSHFGHHGIIQLANRPFANVTEMDEAIIQNWNACVKPEDTVFHLGDYCWYKDSNAERIFRRLNGVKSLIKGNHDPQQTIDLDWHEAFHYHELKMFSKKVILFHYPIDSWNGMYRGSLHFHGHVHNSIPDSKNVKRNRFNISCEMTEYKPINLEEFISNNKGE